MSLVLNSFGVPHKTPASQSVVCTNSVGVSSCRTSIIKILLGLVPLESHISPTSENSLPSPDSTMLPYSNFSSLLPAEDLPSLVLSASKSDSVDIWKLSTKIKELIPGMQGARIENLTWRIMQKKPREKTVQSQDLLDSWNLESFSEYLTSIPNNTDHLNSRIFDFEDATNLNNDGTLLANWDSFHDAFSNLTQIPVQTASEEIFDLDITHSTLSSTCESLNSLFNEHPTIEFDEDSETSHFVPSPSFASISPQLQIIKEPDQLFEPAPVTESKKDTPQKSKSNQRENCICSNCGTTNTSLWRRDKAGEPLCNACGLFFKLHGVMRPISMKSDVVRKRNRGNKPLPISPSALSRRPSKRNQNGAAAISPPPQPQLTLIGSERPRTRRSSRTDAASGLGREAAKVHPPLSPIKRTVAAIDTCIPEPVFEINSTTSTREGPVLIEIENHQTNSTNQIIHKLVRQFEEIDVEELNLRVPTYLFDVANTAAVVPVDMFDSGDNQNIDVPLPKRIKSAAGVPGTNSMVIGSFPQYGQTYDFDFNFEDLEASIGVGSMEFEWPSFTLENSGIASSFPVYTCARYMRDEFVDTTYFDL
ncbi:hypothetical protein HK096_007951 [Nowakowskiella sp. JEL0078]|nr:hypothetical protein HK096_007951 [Nowakowskiella sp. JEL0078]